MSSVTIRKSDQIMMSLVHYFVTKKNYAPIHVQGVKDEIWLENLDGPYRIIRITCNSIINEEQYKFDIFKMKHVMKQIKKKTLSLKMNALNICLDMSQKVGLNDVKDIETVNVSSLKEIKKNELMVDAFPDINTELMETNDGLELIINVTNDINEKTIQDHLYSKDLPNIDFLIRTSNEKRLSNFMLWQASYAELYFTKTLWPAFTKRCLIKALKDYSKRDRRFGGVKK